MDTIGNEWEKEKMDLEIATGKRMLIVFFTLMLAIGLSACGRSGNNQQSENILSSSVPGETQSSEPEDASGYFPSEESESIEQSGENRQIYITAGDGNGMIFQLNDSSAANAFYRQLPLSVSVEDYGGSEKIFYPSEALDIHDAPAAQGPPGILAYYEPWGNIAIFYGECEGAEGLYKLGETVSGTEFIAGMSGEARIESVEDPAAQESAEDMNSQENEIMKMNVQVGERIFTATLEENAAVEGLAELMKDAPLVIQMSDYSGFEKVGSLGTELSANDRHITTQSGDIVLYNGNQIVIFYGSNSWSYTRLGKIDDLTGWEEAFGSGSITVTLSIEN